jgi:hypothetical protein
VKRLAMVALAILVVGEAYAATVVLTGGKRLDVAGYSVSGSYVVVQYPNGRRESYPLSAVNLEATRAASGEKAPAAGPAEPSGPHSPFLGARSATGGGAVVVTDADVGHIEPPEGESEEKKEEGAGPGTESQVVLASYEKKRISDTEWEITATVANQGQIPVQGVTAAMRVLDAQGKPVATGSGTLPGRLEPGKQGTITARVAVEGEPMQVAVDLTWQEIRPAPKAVASPSSAPAAATPAPQAAAPQAPTPGTPGWTRPAGSSPNSLPANLMAVPPANVLGSPGQVPPPPEPTRT